MQDPLNSPLRVALFTDTFHEANGVATLSRHLVDFAHARNLPFLVVHGGSRTAVKAKGSIRTLELKRSAFSFPIDKTLYFDPLLTRYKQLVTKHVLNFKPDLIHITGPGDVGSLGVLLAHVLGVPSVGSWHTNLHEYLARRLDRVLHFLPSALRHRACSIVERQSLRGLMRFYRTARFVLAPNQKAVDLLHQRTGKPAFLMQHGVDLTGYRPPHSGRSHQPFCIGYVGRFTTEKNVRSFVELERKLIAAGERNFNFLLVGEGGQQKYLQKHLRNAEFPGVLRGVELANAYARMNAFVFPSNTDTFGLVILEAMATGIPVILAPLAGEHIGIEDGVSGLLSEDFAGSVQLLMNNHVLRESMGLAALSLANRSSWQVVFQQLYQTYAEGLEAIRSRQPEEAVEGAAVHAVSNNQASLEP